MNRWATAAIVSALMVGPLGPVPLRADDGPSGSVVQFPLVESQEYTHGSWYKFWRFPYQPSDWTQPHDFSRGTTYFRFEITEISEPAMLQFCYFQDKHVSEKHACGPQWSFDAPGVYYRRIENGGLWQRQAIDWTRELLDFMLIDNLSEGAARTRVRVSMFVVAAGYAFEPPSPWECPESWGCHGVGGTSGSGGASGGSGGGPGAGGGTSSGGTADSGGTSGVGGASGSGGTGSGDTSGSSGGASSGGTSGGSLLESSGGSGAAVGGWGGSSGAGGDEEAGGAAGKPREPRPSASGGAATQPREASGAEDSGSCAWTGGRGAPGGLAGTLLLGLGALVWRRRRALA